MNRSATASLHSATPKKNVPCFSDMVVVKFFLKKERTFFFGVLPSKYSGRWRNNADEVLAKLFFGERICQNFGSFVFEFGCRKWKRRGLGRNFPFAPLFVLAKFGADNILLHYTIILVYNVIGNAIMWIMKSESAKLGKNLKRIRTEKSITQGDIVRNLGVSRSFISNIENGKTNPTLSTITNIAKALGVSSDELLK